MDADLARIVQELSSENVVRRCAAAERLAQRGEEAAAACVALVRACGDSDEVRDWAASALESCGAPPLTALDELASLTTHEQLDVAYWAATLIGRLGPQAAAATPQLIKCASGSEHESVRRRASWALERIRRSR